MIIALIGARNNPKGEEWKLKGHHLALWPIKEASNSKYIKEFFISTNSKSLPRIIEFYSPNTKIIPRPDQLGSPTATDLEWISHALNYLRNKEVHPEIIVHLRASTPTIQIEKIDKAIEVFLVNKKATSLRSAHALSESPHKMFIKENEYFKPFMKGIGEFYNRPRQDFPTVYHPNGYVDILRPEVIQSGSLHGDRILAFETEFVQEIDSYEDLIKLENDL